MYNLDRFKIFVWFFLLCAFVQIYSQHYINGHL